jgi:multimeric flavodoxin WrbA
MNTELSRRKFVSVTAAAAALAGTLASTPARAASSRANRKLLGIACSPRKGMTTAKAVQTALDAAKGVDPALTVELIDLGGLSFGGYSPKPPQDDFTPLLAKLQDPAVVGLIIGSPSYFRAMSALCKAFLERCGPLRDPKMLLDGKPVGVIATGAFRNGGQELVIEQIQTVMLCFGMIPVGGRPPAFQGGTVHSTKDSIDADELGLTTARNTGMRVAEIAMKLVK